MSVLLQTSFGDITIDLFTAKAPNACLNFLKLCKLKHYNNAMFAEIQKNYVTKVRTSQPTTVWKECGQAQPYFRDEIDVEGRINEIGLVATANSGPNLNNSEFFITLTRANIASLAGKHTVFGKVEEGLDVLKRISDTYVDNNYRPQMNIRILHTFLLDDPFPDPPALPSPPRSPSPVRNSDRLEAVEHLEMLQKCKNESEIIEATRQQKAKKQAMTLEILGDLPDASLKPPENILFICKLNPITQEKDLEVIFSRFGPVKSVEIVRDWKTGQSLQYGFIEFENITSCEEAYIKMNNVVIDDRRIQVDFSQSVSKLLHRNNKQGIMTAKPKYGEPPSRARELLPKSYTEGKDKTQKYDLVIPNSQPKAREDRRDPEEHRERREQQRKRRERSGEREKKRKESRSRSNSRRKHRKRSDSSGKARKDKKKKSSRYASDSSS